eukprot:TRINITY_DN6583_c0_g1_i1.p1 TRINITY_DN6583_c0_g1~~TRINITY_DN6583_c0_g1_i1.p1  ORF type:complete len:354 (-),score=64.48 TRINITY_DN6583_c0_g1_i1:239-1300(-)
MYVVEATPRKGLGCIATTKIKLGSLISREKPILYVDPIQREKDRSIIHNMNIQMCLTGEAKGKIENVLDIIRVVESFSKLSAADQEEFLNLKDWEEPHENVEDSDAFEKHFNMLEKVLNVGLDKLPFDTVKKVARIYKTNTHHNGVCLKTSRFNHACRPNAECFWNRATATRDIRAIKTIMKGEEITNVYGSECLPKKERKNFLSKNWNFECCCETCELKGKDLETDDIRRRKFLQLEKEQEANVGNPEKELETIKALYQLGKDIGGVRIMYILDNIVSNGFDAACQGYLNSWKQNVKFLSSIESFASLGLKLSKILYGKSHPENTLWEMKKANPIQTFLAQDNIENVSGRPI